MSPSNPGHFILNIYTCTVSTQALDIRVDRRVLNLIIGVGAMAVVVYFVLNSDFATTIDFWLISIGGWLSPWGSVVLVHWFLIARRQIDAESLFATSADSALPMVRPTALVALALGVTATWMFMYGMLPALQAPSPSPSVGSICRGSPGQSLPARRTGPWRNSPRHALPEARPARAVAVGGDDGRKPPAASGRRLGFGGVGGNAASR